MTRNFKKTPLNPIVTMLMVLAVFTLTLIIKKREEKPTPKPHINQASTAPVQHFNKQVTTYQTHHIHVKKGDTLHSIFAELKVPQKDFWKLINSQTSKPVPLKQGQTLDITLDNHQQLQTLRIPLANNRVLLFSKENNTFKKQKITLATEIIKVFKSGEIISSFGKAAKKAALPNSVYQDMLKIFSGKINFSRDLRTGDTFSVLYEEARVEGKKPTIGHIIATEFHAKHKDYQAVYFEYPKHHSGYYTPTGAGIEGRFLEFPLKFKRISSRFNRHRLDPITHKIQSHSGVDLAAPSGTPIHSIGDGKIIFIGQSRGYGNMIKVRYDRHYTGLYAHMRKFAKKLKLNQHVSKGQVIGYVGQTGWATGPHLHFGFYVNGVAQDWLALDHPTTQAVPRQYLKAFKQKATEALAALKFSNAAL